MKILFIGNSATYVHKVPTMLETLAKGVGIDVTAEKITLGGCTIAQHADKSTDHGKSVREAIAKSYDVVFLQDNGNCIADDERRTACRTACGELAEDIAKSGAKLYFYVRPPYEAEKFGYDSIGQCRELDLLFSKIAAELGATCAFANRAFAYAIMHHDIDLWGPDRAHTSLEGAYLVAATIFATLFDRPATVLDTIEGVDENIARTLLEVAEKIVHGGVIPWENT